MYKDLRQWREIRQRVLIQGVSKRQIQRDTGIHRQTLAKILQYPTPSGYRRSKSVEKEKLCKKADVDFHDNTINQICDSIQNIVSGLPVLPRKNIPRKEFIRLIRQMHEVGLAVSPITNQRNLDLDYHKWMTKVIHGAEKVCDIQEKVGKVKDLDVLLQKAVDGRLKDRNRAITVLAHLRGTPFNSIARYINKSSTQVSKYWQKYESKGAKGLFEYYPPKSRKAENEQVRSAVFSLLHSPPSEHNINRTSWKLDDLKKCLYQKGIVVSKDVIREIIHTSGYKWRKAKIVLTSHDPQYQEKLAHIESILSKLGKNDRFCSIDEFGPFAVKMKGGRRLVAPDEYPSVPQFQVSKGIGLSEYHL